MRGLGITERKGSTMLTITTTYKTNDKGQGRITAKGGGKQRTVAYDHSASPDRNHGLAAGTLALALGLNAQDADNAQHTNNHDGTHTFRVGR